MVCNHLHIIGRKEGYFVNRFFPQVSRHDGLGQFHPCDGHVQHSRAFRRYGGWCAVTDAAAGASVRHLPRALCADSERPVLRTGLADARPRIPAELRRCVSVLFRGVCAAGAVCAYVPTADFLPACRVACRLAVRGLRRGHLRPLWRRARRR